VISMMMYVCVLGGCSMDDGQKKKKKRVFQKKRAFLSTPRQYMYGADQEQKEKENETHALRRAEVQLSEKKKSSEQKLKQGFNGKGLLG